MTVLLLTSTLADAPLLRIKVHPSEQNGFREGQAKKWTACEQSMN
jgi:hypothetical protein